MPHANIWIRKEDWSKWEAIADKPTWLHMALNGDYITERQNETPPKPKPPPVTFSAKPITPQERTETIKAGGMFDKSTGACGHYLDGRGRCTVKKCKGTKA